MNDSSRTIREPRQTRVSPSGELFEQTEFTYGTLAAGASDPLCNVSVANSSLSIDIWVGCRWQCAYCHVQGSAQDTDTPDGGMPRTPRRRTAHTIRQIVDAVVAHPFFVPDETPISIGTASTEPLTPGPVAASTFEIASVLSGLDLRNPIWIVTKRGVSRSQLEAISRLRSHTRGLLLSISWADNPREIEPIHTDRFLLAREAAAAGATVSWHLRPLAPNWSGTRDGIERMMQRVSAQHGDVISSIVPGGLRWSEGIDMAMRDVHHVPFPNIPRPSHNDKFLDEDLAADIVDLAATYFPSIPVFFKSSCALTHMLQVASQTSVQRLNRHDCLMSVCPSRQRSVCERGKVMTMTAPDAQMVADRLQIPLRVVEWLPRNLPTTDPPLADLPYGYRQALVNNLAVADARSEERLE